ncbi:MAG: hypothetical protein M1820_003976 [Bogoriella megaspora]|nr:MAG: hypothetical protein M1820_003976 [Bogoriella megaspora]
MPIAKRTRAALAESSGNVVKAPPAKAQKTTRAQPKRTRAATESEDIENRPSKRSASDAKGKKTTFSKPPRASKKDVVDTIPSNPTKAAAKTKNVKKAPSKSQKSSTKAKRTQKSKITGGVQKAKDVPSQSGEGSPVQVVDVAMWPKDSTRSESPEVFTTRLSRLMTNTDINAVTLSYMLQQIEAQARSEKEDDPEAAKKRSEGASKAWETKRRNAERNAKLGKEFVCCELPGPFRLEYEEVDEQTFKQVACAAHKPGLADKKHHDGCLNRKSADEHPEWSYVFSSRSIENYVYWLNEEEKRRPDPLSDQNYEDAQYMTEIFENQIKRLNVELKKQKKKPAELMNLWNEVEGIAQFLLSEQFMPWQNTTTPFVNLNIVVMQALAVMLALVELEKAGHLKPRGESEYPNIALVVQIFLKFWNTCGKMDWRLERQPFAKIILDFAEEHITLDALPMSKVLDETREFDLDECYASDDVPEHLKEMVKTQPWIWSNLELLWRVVGEPEDWRDTEAWPHLFEEFKERHETQRNILSKPCLGGSRWATNKAPIKRVAIYDETSSAWDSDSDESVADDGSDGDLSESEIAHPHTILYSGETTTGPDGKEYTTFKERHFNGQEEVGEKILESTIR